MNRVRSGGVGMALTLALCLSGCSHEDKAAQSTSTAGAITVTITGSGGPHVLTVEAAKTAKEQERGLMFRTAIAANGGMLFYPYPPDGGPPKAASFWMKNTPSPLDIVFIRANGTIARIAEEAPPFSETPILSNEPVAAILEIRGGRALDLDISEGDTVRWAGFPKQ